MTRTLAALFVFVLPLTAAPVPKSAKKQDDTKAILGQWRGGIAPVAENGTVYAMRFADDGTCGLTTGQGGQESPAKYTLTPTGTPKRMTWNNGTEWQCVYELDGDTLRVGFVPHGKPIPDTLELKDGLTVYELKRLKDDK